MPRYIGCFPVLQQDVGAVFMILINVPMDISQNQQKLLIKGKVKALICSSMITK